MFNEPKYSDVSIKIGDIQVAAHQFVICLQSRYLEDALNGGFAEGSTKTLECPPQKEHAYLRILRYLYTGDYEEEPSSLIAHYEDDPELLRDPRVYFLADSFFLDELKTLAQEKFMRKLDELWVSEGFTACVAEIYANTIPETGSGIRSAVINISVNHIDELLLRTTFVALVDGGGDFAVELLRALAMKQGDGKRRSSYD